MRISLRLYLLLLMIFGTDINTIRAQVSPLLISDTANFYEPIQDVIVNGQLLKVRNKFSWNWGINCQFEVEITNIRQKEVSARTNLLMTRTNTLNPNTSVDLRLKPEFYAVDVPEVTKKSEKFFNKLQGMQPMSGLL